MRTTKSEVVAVFKMWVKAINGHVAVDYKDVGGYRLDYDSVYGGYEIECICNVHGGASVVSGRRETASTFVYGLRLAMRTLEEAMTRKRIEHVSRCPKRGDGCSHFNSLGEVK